MNTAQRRKYIAAFAVLGLICIAVIGCLYLFASPDGWLTLTPSHYTSTSPPPEDAVLLIPTDQDYEQYPHLKALLQHPGANFPISDNPFVRMRQGASVVSGQEAGELLGKYGLGRGNGYILSDGRYYITTLIVT